MTNFVNCMNEPCIICLKQAITLLRGKEKKEREKEKSNNERDLCIAYLFILKQFF